MALNYNRTVAEVFEEACQTYGDKAAFTCLDKTLSFNEVEQLSARFAAYLQEHTKLEPGDRIAIQLPNVLQYPIAVFGALRAGLVVVNTNPLYTPHEIKHQLQDSGAKALVVLANIAHNAAKVVDETEVEQVIVTELADFHPPLKRTLLNFAVKYVKKMVPPFEFRNQVSLRDAMAKVSQPFKPVQRTPEDIAVLQYTGGTTGVAKGAMLTNQNLVANMTQLNGHMCDLLGEGNELFVAPLPLYHIYAFTLHCMSAVALGNHNLLIPNPRDIGGFVKMLKGKPFTVFVGLNTLFNALCRNADFANLDFSHLHLTSSGGMALTASTAKRWKEVTGCDIYEGYGLTETSPVVSSNPAGKIQQGTVGIPLPETECKVIDEEGKDVRGEEPGELCVRGPQVMKGYWNRPEETERSIDAEGWFKTGDMAIIQKDGYIKIVDRKKDMINVSGFKVFPNEVEDVLSGHPDILEAAVVGISDGDGSESVKAYVVTSRDMTVEEVREHAKTKLTAYKVPHEVEFRDELPKTNVGKVLRRALKEEQGK
ncbi:AMP-binding protein [Marinimicrobium sp. ABcell2]|uniref:AMP-binding protein n=1 Tax=Marinimicrobium sp. ABcell2 TaxID=3069751 RepID=UPI0027ADA630|nr:AMP-binding protein [Marinimicrobium sp. ABcell2]MDQ2075467.1 AMP-binding protein [Marinimicrobium sp. ABcell2]